MKLLALVVLLAVSALGQGFPMGVLPKVNSSSPSTINITAVQQVLGSRTTDGTAEATLTTDRVVGNLIVVGFLNDSGDGQATGVTDGDGNTYEHGTSCDQLTGGQNGVDVWYAKNILGDTGNNIVTIAYAGTAGYAWVGQYEGGSTTAPFDVCKTFANTSSGSFNVAVDDSLALVFLVKGPNGTACADFTALHAPAFNQFNTVQLTNAALASGAHDVITCGGNTNNAGVVAIFK